MKLKNIFHFILLTSTCFSGFSFSETYTWTDKKGHKHYGDEIPKEYISQGKQVDTKTINTIPSVESTPPNTNTNNTTTNFIEVPNASPKTSDACEQQKRDYLNAQHCYNDCRMAGGGINKAKCANCKDVKKPGC